MLILKSKNLDDEPGGRGTWSTACYFVPGNSLEEDIGGGHTNDYSPINYYDWDPLEYYEMTSIPDIDQTWGCSTCGPSYEWAYMTHYYANNLSYPSADGLDTLTLTAHTQQKLMTGGKAGVHRQNLFCISASATAYGQPPLGGWSFYPWWGTSATNVNPSQLQALGKPVGADGNLWVVLPDNASPDLDLIAKGKDHYNATATVAKYPLIIKANDITLSNDVVATGADFCVGQDVPFVVSGWPTDGSVIATNFQWSLDGIYVNRKIPAPNGNSSDNYTNDATLLKNAMITNCWWVSGKTNPAIYQASVSCTLIFTNGNPSAKVSAKGLFGIVKPWASWVGSQGSVAGDTNWELSGGNFSIHYGYYLPTGHQPGMTFTGVTTWTQGGSFHVVQLIDSTSSEFCGTNGHTAHLSGIGLDHAHYAIEDSWNGSYFHDDPGVQCGDGNNHVFDSGYFETFLVFNPNTSGSIEVPIKLIAWDWIGTADAAGAWHLTTPCTGHITINDYETVSFPTWTNVVGNFPTGYTYSTNNTCN